MVACAAAASTPSRAQACSFIECERWLDVDLAQVGPIPAGETALVLRPVLSEEFPRFNLEGSQAAVTVTGTLDGVRQSDALPIRRPSRRQPPPP